MSYTSPDEDMRTILFDKSIAPLNQVVIGGRTETFPGDYQVVIRIASSRSNPKWLYDDITYSFLIVGQNRMNQGTAKDVAWNIYNSLLGADAYDVGDNKYLQFNGQSMPEFLGYSEDNSKPIYVCSLVVNRQVQVEEFGGNRKPLS